MLFLSDLKKKTFNFVHRFSQKKSQISNFTNIRPVGGGGGGTNCITRTDGQTDRQTRYTEAQHVNLICVINLNKYGGCHTHKTFLTTKQSCIDLQGGNYILRTIHKNKQRKISLKNFNQIADAMATLYPLLKETII